MKWLQNKKSKISTDLIRNLKIKIILLSVLNQYFFENCHFHIESISNRILSVSCTDFSILPMIGPEWSKVCGQFCDKISDKLSLRPNSSKGH